MSILRPLISRAPQSLRTPIVIRQSQASLCRATSRAISHPRRCYATDGAPSVEPPDYLDERERKVFDTIKQELQPSRLEVQDISGGCGSMYAIDVVSAQFKGMPVIKQHRLVNKVLGDQIKDWHGVQLKTKAS